VIDFVTIATTGNATDFGDLLTPLFYTAGASNSTRAIIGGGSPSTNVIQYVTIATTGNALDFGDLTRTQSRFDACASSTIVVFGGGDLPSQYNNTMDYVTIATTGNALDFGDLTVAVYGNTGTSNCHGGVA
jgi:hypothetical protein